MRFSSITPRSLWPALLAASLGLAAQTAPTPKNLTTYHPPRNAIYHKGWIDFNKNGRKDIYEDPTQPVERRIDDLLAQMTLDEKTCQMVTLYGYGRVLADALPTPEWKNKIWRDGMGAIDEHLNGFQQWGLPPSNNPNVWPASRHAWALNEVQRFFVEQTRLGIPTDFTNEGIRGVEAYKATNFPTQLGLGHTWNRALIRRVGYITGREARLLGYTNVYAPILDVTRDQRWGRCEENYGESPYLVAELGIEMTKGMQTDRQVASTGKHYLAYSNNKGAREGMSRTDPQMSPRELEYVHAYPWTRVIGEAGMLGVMVSYNDYDGFPIESSSYWLNRRLRGQMGFRGYTVSDSDAVEYLYSKHGTARDMKEAVRQSVMAGLNVRCTFRSPDSYVLPLRELVNEGGVPIDTINARVRDILRVKFLVGLFDHPYQEDLKQADQEVNSAENNAVALQASRECLVLLKNQNALLPLDRNKTKRIAVCGPNADETSFALTHYGPLAVEVTSVLQGIRQLAAKGTEVSYAKGCDLVDATWPESEILPQPLTAQEQAQIDSAAALAAASDVAVVVLGGGQRTCGENKSRTSLDLPGRQLDLLRAVWATGTPVVLVLINGRPLTINWAQQNVPAIIEAWYPGSQGGRAVAEALFGDYNPGGKLTVTFPKTVGQIPFNFPHKPASQVDGGGEPGPQGNQSRVNGWLYPFGFGLSYTTFKYDNLHLSKTTIRPDEGLTVTCDVTNTGNRAGDEVVQLYTHDVLSSLTTYEKNLRGFERVHLEPGQTRTVGFALHPRDLMLLNERQEWVVEPGDFNIMIGASSEDIKLNGLLTVTEGDGTPTATITTNRETALLRAVTDGNDSTRWQAAVGDYLTLPLSPNSTPKEIKIKWSSVESGATFKLQLSGGGGQFLDVFAGPIKAGWQTVKFAPTTASDLRLLITRGSASVDEVALPELKP